MTRLPHLVSGLLAALLLGLTPSSAVAEDGAVKEIRVEGTRRADPAAVRRVIGQKAGAPLDAARIDKDVRAIMRLGFFSDVVVEETGPADAPILIYRVTEKPTVREVRTLGREKLSKDDLKETVEVKAFSTLDLGAVKKDVEKIKQKYVEKGYFLADVSWRIEEKPDNQVDVVYQVDERAKVQVKEVRFVGNRQVPKEEIVPYMETREGGLLSFLSSAGTFKEEAFQTDLQRIQALYLDKGYVDVKVGKPTVALSPDRRWLFLTIPVEEGERYTIGKLAFEGDLLGLGEDELRRRLKARSGDLFSRTAVGSDLFALGDVYKDRGHAYANVTPLTATNPATRIVDLTYEIAPGPKVAFERIEVIGNDKTRDKVIRRELKFAEGELYSGTGLRVSKNRVTALGFFETVEITTRKGTADDKVIATVEVKERPTGTFQVGAGFSSYENFILTGQISQNNFFGWGQTLSLQLQWSSVRQLGQIQFVEPYFLDTRWTFAFDLYATEGVYTTFTRRAVGGSMTWGYELSGLRPWWEWAKNLEDVRLFATYTNERVDVSAASGTFETVNQFRSGTTSSLRLQLQADKRDNRLFPTSGWYTSVSSELAPPVLSPTSVFGEQVNRFTRWSFDARFYRPILWGIVARAKVTLGYIAPWPGAQDVPISERYYVGGINSVRGYRFLSIAPSGRVPTSASPDAPTVLRTLGGDKQAVLNLELEFPLFEKAGVKGVVFADAGNAFDEGQWSDPAVSLSLYKSIGFGFRWVSPIGPLRFEWGIPLDRRTDPAGVTDQPLDFQFTIGSFF